MTTHEPAIFAHDDRTLFYPTAPGRVFAIAFADLAAHTGAPAHFADHTEETDLGGMTTTTIGPDAADVPRMLCPLTASPRKAPYGFIKAAARLSDDDLGEVAEDFADLLGAWADWCDEQEAAAEVAARAA